MCSDERLDLFCIPNPFSPPPAILSSCSNYPGAGITRLVHHLLLPPKRSYPILFVMESMLCDLSDISDLSSLPPSPRSSPEPSTRFPTPSSQDSEDSTRQDCPPPAKKRRRNPLPKERTTQYLYLSKSSYEQQDQVKLLVDTLRHQKDIVAITGAGISTSAGSKFFSPFLASRALHQA